MSGSTPRGSCFTSHTGLGVPGGPTVTLQCEACGKATEQEALRFVPECGIRTRCFLIARTNPQETMRPGPLPGYVWLDTRGKRMHVWAAALEFQNDPPD
jgi:hypothetical protein